jgi:hypothetical protein
MASKLSADKGKKADKKMPPKRAIVDNIVKNAKVPGRASPSKKK